LQYHKQGSTREHTVKPCDELFFTLLSGCSCSRHRLKKEDEEEEDKDEEEDYKLCILHFWKFLSQGHETILHSSRLETDDSLYCVSNLLHREPLPAPGPVLL